MKFSIKMNNEWSEDTEVDEMEGARKEQTVTGVHESDIFVTEAKVRFQS